MRITPKFNQYINKAITVMTKNNSMVPIAALEGTVVAGRTYQAYKRGKGDEARERFLEEITGSITWLFGVLSLNKLGDKIVNKILKANGKVFDVGTDHVLRTPFENFMKKLASKKFTPTQVALIKGGKVLTSVILANIFIGLVVPKINQGITKHILEKRKAEKQPAKQEQNLNINQPAFKGSAIINGINVFTNAIENTTTGTLLSSDAGIVSGRMYSARSKEERREIAIRDIGSIYFYMWAQRHVGNILNMIESGKSTRLNPTMAGLLDKYLKEVLNGKEVSVDEFKNIVLGKEEKLPDNIKFEVEKLSTLSKYMKKKPLEVVKLSELEKIITDTEVLARMKEMSKLQPLRQGEAVLTKQQVIDSFNNCAINNPKFLDKVFGEFTENAHKDEFKFVSNKKLYALKQEMIDYVENICKSAKEGKVNNKLLDKLNNKNTMFNGINFLAGFTVAALFLSTLIPKFQYYVTKKTTGVDAFPGTYDYEKHSNLSEVA